MGLGQGKKKPNTTESVKMFFNRREPFHIVIDDRQKCWDGRCYDDKNGDNTVTVATEQNWKTCLCG